eukprot:CAMPEP_0198447970 /NCGR_PEP_ID=MMETSP1453-20131121/2993_1 /TAXON_ID=1461543 ORGANISM="Unidentified sp., Strain RCC701" /NCGR_SAMPLE_ID=MMETSP1453 /ASSEMBLY_ACC=CAM_ASM_001118 /LENGTH=62 /DNA_ID=CAMNT_0044170181 /DNA_START=135 /DNA_END=320 /DNA_ORIENTATION=-
MKVLASLVLLSAPRGPQGKRSSGEGNRKSAAQTPSGEGHSSSMFVVAQSSPCEENRRHWWRS